MHFREGNTSDVAAIVALYRGVAERSGGIARAPEEITESYVHGFVSDSQDRGLIIVCEHPEEPTRIIAEIHAFKPGISVFDHVFSNLTLVVDPDFQGRKIGRTLMTIFLEEIARNRNDVGKVELIVRESNSSAISLYQSLGFRIEGRLEMRIRTASREYEADIPMGWQNPSYDF